MSRKQSQYDFGDYDDYRDDSYDSYDSEEGSYGENSPQASSFNSPASHAFQKNEIELAYLAPEYDKSTKLIVQVFTRQGDKQKFYVSEDALDVFYDLKKPEICQTIPIEPSGISNDLCLEVFIFKGDIFQVLVDEDGEKFYYDIDDVMRHLTHDQLDETFIIPLILEDDIKNYTEKDIKKCVRAVKSQVRKMVNPSDFVVRLACIDNHLDINRSVGALINHLKDYQDKARSIAPNQPIISVTNQQKQQQQKPPKKANNQQYKNITLTRIEDDQPNLPSTTTSKKKPIPKMIRIQEKQQSLSAALESPSTTSSGGSSPLPRKKIKLYFPKPDSDDVEQKRRISIVIIGHVDAGKSTLTGQLLYQLKQVSERKMAKLKRESELIGKGSFHFAWVMDSEEEERTRGVTIDVARRHFETENRKVSILDAPGHRDFIPNMIRGAAQADCAIVVIDSSKGEFEKGFHKGGQTREHILLAKSLGIRKFCFAINKLDSMNWSFHRFDEIRTKLKRFMEKHVAVKDSKFIPLSGMEGDNVLELSKNTPWYRSKLTLVDYINAVLPIERNLKKKCRFLVDDYFKENGDSLVMGQLVQGVLVEGQSILMQPNNHFARIKSITRHGVTVRTAFAGDSLALTLSQVDVDAVGDIHLLSYPTHPVPYVRKFRAHIVMLDDPKAKPILCGSQMVFHNAQVEVPCTIYRIKNILDATGKQIVSRNPKKVSGANVQSIVRIRTKNRIPLEIYNEASPVFGRFSLRMNGVTVAAGIVKNHPRSKGLCPFQYELIQK
mmetsp:Transcript_10400/g.15209  ORF Transcript_10400/g.15209 Transcript_10400/m.15209 type:complete len:778 (-) Transcript_10400:35-2368(-)